MLKIYYNVHSEDMVEITVPSIGYGYTCKSILEVDSIAKDVADGQLHEIIKVTDENFRESQGEGYVEIIEPDF
ncbi:hypothetical protein [Vibrio methylphosphonaticus]|uniref:hypothetical protein n=1 Tax=Vibrio methylphosphonaticus TaxID=2946866 RepID=UPI002029CDEF|nr:hypothetical protein [Vibrio methylphosphonaticus]MCL9777605.1 hypothetical protein [Vibrio methylphosphonaticus]